MLDGWFGHICWQSHLWPDRSVGNCCVSNDCWMIDKRHSTFDDGSLLHPGCKPLEKSLLYCSYFGLEWFHVDLPCLITPLANIGVSTGGGHQQNYLHGVWCLWDVSGFWFGLSRSHNIRKINAIKNAEPVDSAPKDSFSVCRIIAFSTKLAAMYQ